jgi:hypothetical protein
VTSNGFILLSFDQFLARGELAKLLLKQCLQLSFPHNLGEGEQ